MTKKTEIPLSALLKESRQTVDVVALVNLVLDNPRPTRARNGQLWVEKDTDNFVHMNVLLAREMVKALAAYRHLFRVLQIRYALRSEVTEDEWRKWYTQAFERC